jgi:hypothetical protein
MTRPSGGGAAKPCRSERTGGPGDGIVIGSSSSPRIGTYQRVAGVTSEITSRILVASPASD